MNDVENSEKHSQRNSRVQLNDLKTDYDEVLKPKSLQQSELETGAKFIQRFHLDGNEGDPESIRSLVMHGSRQQKRKIVTKSGTINAHKSDFVISERVGQIRWEVEVPP